MWGRRRGTRQPGKGTSARPPRPAPHGTRDGRAPAALPVPGAAASGAAVHAALRLAGGIGKEERQLGTVAGAQGALGALVGSWRGLGAGEPVSLGRPVPGQCEGRGGPGRALPLQGLESRAGKDGACVARHSLPWRLPRARRRLRRPQPPLRRGAGTGTPAREPALTAGTPKRTGPGWKAPLREAPASTDSRGVCEGSLAPGATAHGPSCGLSRLPAGVRGQSLVTPSQAEPRLLVKESSSPGQSRSGWGLGLARLPRGGCHCA